MSLSAEIHTSIEAIGQDVWDRLAPDNNPFLSYRFLHELEASKSVGPQESGWLPHHIELKDGGDTCALIPLYIKLDSYGEYIFDWAWARAAHQAGIQYYPKLVVAVPFTPVTGQRILLGFFRRIDRALGQMPRSSQALCEATRRLIGSYSFLHGFREPTDRPT